MGNRARVLDSTPLYDAVATQDTVTQLRAAIRKLLVVLDNLAPQLAGAVRGALSRDDEYARPGKPPCDWDDRAAREALVDELVHDALSALAALDGAALSPRARDAADLLALVAGQDVEQGDDGTLSHRQESGQGPGHLDRRHRGPPRPQVGQPPLRRLQGPHLHRPRLRAHRRGRRHRGQHPRCQGRSDLLASDADEEDKPEVVGDSAYGSAAARSRPGGQGYAVMAKAAPVRNSTGGFTKEDFAIDLEVGAVTCPAGQVAPVHSDEAARARPRSRATAATAR